MGVKIYQARTQKGKIKRMENSQVVKFLLQGELVVFPTETVYGVGVDAFNRKAVAALARAKNRPLNQPFSLHLGSEKQTESLIRGSVSSFEKIVDIFWPGPLTLILPATEKVPEWIKGPRETVGLRLPDFPAARDLALELGRPLAATSANLSGRLSPTTVEHALGDLSSSVRAVIDGGPADWGLESTVLDLSTENPRILRRGAVEVEALEEVLGEKIIADKATDRPHYQPGIPLYFCPNPQKGLKKLKAKGFKEIAYFGPDQIADEAISEYRTSSGDRLGLKNFYRNLRELENHGQVILAVPPQAGKYRDILTSRLQEAATEHIE